MSLAGTGKLVNHMKCKHLLTFGLRYLSPEEIYSFTYTHICVDNIVDVVNRLILLPLVCVGKK